MASLTISMERSILKTTQLAIMTFFDTDAGRTQMEMTDCSHNAIYRLVAIIFMEESIEF